VSHRVALAHGSAMLEAQYITRIQLRGHGSVCSAVLDGVYTKPFIVPGKVRLQDPIRCLQVVNTRKTQLNLELVSRELVRILHRDGLLIASIPLENALYRVGRWSAGFAKRAIYHRSGVAVVRHALEEEGLMLANQVSLPPALRLFEIDVFKRS